MNDVSILMLTFSLCIEQSNGFFARTIRDGNWRTRTHLDITAAGTFRAIEKYIKFNKRPGSGSIEDFFKMKLIARQNDLDELITQLGECLYTIQSFYSNTNWVEMYGGVVYEDFGINDLMEVATLEEDTCLDNAEYKYVKSLSEFNKQGSTGFKYSHCMNNIIVNGKLTSGYHHGRGNTKPASRLPFDKLLIIQRKTQNKENNISLEAVGSLTGKCNHGGPDDDSRKLVARCGINKESFTPEWSPHSHLHEQAYTAAVQATENFLVANEIFKRRKDMTLAFAIDYTASMADEIDAVKNTSDKAVKKHLSLNSAHRYVDGHVMINKVQAIEAENGDNGDCPEYAFAGILAGNIPSTEIIDSFDWSASLKLLTKILPLIVRSQCSKISVTGSSAETDVDIYHANGTMETYTSENQQEYIPHQAKPLYQSRYNIKYVPHQQPPGGIMKLRRNVISDWKVNITAQSSIKDDFELKKSDTSEMISLKGSQFQEFKLNYGNDDSGDHSQGSSRKFTNLLVLD
ncbi:unnamed protein product [Mytilus edulis]|uniref:VWA7 N-terminal domain-containing protein n=1 Tax=Mytilus edulis TaxID=6550 RepID=A0A8S3VEH9_MYTED|nr:unnamed protein product [Mytilus edulis]